MEKKKKEKKRERDAAVGHTCATAFDRIVTRTQIGKEQRDETAISTSVRTAKCQEKILGDWDIGRKNILKRFELIDEKDFENDF